ncbi:MAG: TrmH family RNA methyltransferase [Luteibaculaceae bacterium]
MDRKLKTEELNRVSEEEAKLLPKLPICVVLENIRSAHNIGSFFRTADAFSVEKIYLTGYTATPPNREIEKTALGATQTVAWEKADEFTILTQLKSKGYILVAVEQTANSVKINDFNFDKYEKIAFFFGNEVKGINNFTVEHADFCLEIPQNGAKHSLNVSVCGGIVMWKAFENKVFMQ